MLQWLRYGAATFLPLLFINISFLSTAIAEAQHDLNRASNDTLLWGPYRPNVYFGVRAKVPKGLVAGIMWGSPQDLSGVAASQLLLTAM